MTKSCIFGLSIAVMVLALFVSSPALAQNGCKEEVLQPQVTRETAPDATEAELQKLVDGDTAFAFDLYQALRNMEENKGENLFYSPYSISLALAMAYGGARGETEQQMAEALQFTLSQERTHPAFDALDLAITSREEEGIELNVANAFWGQLGHPFLQDYIDLLAKNYGAEIRLLNFQSTPDACREHIDDWVTEKTEGKIEDLLPPGSIDPLTRLVLTNAIYFKGTWKYQFDPWRTHEEAFHLLGGGTQTASMMMVDGAWFGYTEDYLDDVYYQAVELPYVGEELAMVILLPELEKFEEFEQALDADRLGEILGELWRSEVDLTMPKFSFTSGFELKDTLSALGMPDAFSEGADFSGMDGMRDIWIDDVIHKAFIQVDEQGTEAAAATAVVGEGIAAPIEVREFRIDHPFIFLIRDRETGAILFLGRVLNPVEGVKRGG